MLNRLRQAIWLTILLANLGLFAIALPVQASDVQFTPQVSIGDFDKGEGQSVSDTTMGEYIYEIYRYAIAIVGIVAAVVIMFGGVMWITAGGNAARIDDAKAWIGAALIGLVLALFSYTILKTINPELVKIQPIQVTEMGNPIDCCHPEFGDIYFTTKEDGKYVPTCTPPEDADPKYKNAQIDECTENEACKIPPGQRNYECVTRGCCYIYTYFGGNLENFKCRPMYDYEKEECTVESWKRILTIVFQGRTSDVHYQPNKCLSDCYE